MKIEASTKWVLLAVAAAGLYVAFKGVKGAAKSVAKAGVDAAAGALEGTVIGIGGAVGIPETNMSECERAKAEGRTWDASFTCPASDFFGYVLSSRKTTSDGVSPDLIY